MGQCKCWEQQPSKVEASTLNDTLYLEQDYQIQRILQPLKQFETLPLPSYYSQVNDGLDEFSYEKNIPLDKIQIGFAPPKFEEPNIPICDIFKDYPRSEMPIKFDTFVYIGQWKNFEPFGLGTFYYNDGSIYMGYSLNLNPHIFGKKKYPDGSEYEGEYLLGKHHGQGKLINKELCFEGIWCQNIPVKGIEQWVDGTIYEGEYQNGYKHGYGIMKWKNGNHYKGMFDNDQFNGYGVYEFADGIIYEGQWKNSYMNGKGKLIYPNQCYFEGEFANDIQISGVMVSVKGNEKTISDLSFSQGLGTRSIVKIDRPSIRQSNFDQKSLYF